MTSGQDNSSTWRTALRLLQFSFSVDSHVFAATILVSILSSLTEALGLVLLLPLLSAAGMDFPGGTTAGRVAQAFQHLLVLAHVPPRHWLASMLAIFLLTGAGRSMLNRTQSMMVYTTSASVQLALSHRVYSAIVKARWGFLVRQRAGGFIHLLTGELRTTQDAISLSLSLIKLVCLTIVYFAAALKLSPVMTLIVLALGAALMLLQRSSIGRTRASGAALSVSVGEVYAATEEHLLNLKSVKTYDAEERDIAVFGDLCRNVVRDAISTSRHQAASSFWFEVGSLAALGSVIYLSLRVLHVQPSTMLLLLAVFTRLMPQLAILQSQAHQFASILPSFDNILAIEAGCLANAEPKLLESTGPSRVLTRELRLANISFAYVVTDGADASSQPQFVLRNLDLTIKAGIITAVIGPSGAGKSTIADLVNGLLLPTDGQLFLDGIALDADSTRQWRRHVGYVGQDTVLFHQSVRANLLWAMPSASEADLREALHLAAADFVFDLPGGLESIVGDRGILLSSGQRQRISLARALLRKPTLLILDEATNALDLENETRILDSIHEAIRHAQGSLTVLMIAHRASAIRRADYIFELESGQVLRSGTWQSLNPSAS